MDSLSAYTKLSQLPKNLQEEVMDFIDFLLKKNKQTNKSQKPKFGSGKGMFKMSPDFDEPLEDFKEYM